MKKHDPRHKKSCPRSLGFVALAMFLSPATAPAVETGTVEGRVVLVYTAPAGEEREVKRDLTDVVVYLVPSGHELPARPLPPPAKVSQKGAIFRPSVLVVEKGQSVAFPNDDDIDHNVFSFAKAKKFDLGLYKKGVSKTVTFDLPGVVPLFCSIHSNMNAYIFVAPNGLHGTASADGSFKIPGVPPGRYKVRTWHRNLPEGTQFVEVTELAVETGRRTTVKVNLGTGEDQ